MYHNTRSVQSLDESLDNRQNKVHLQQLRQGKQKTNGPSEDGKDEDNDNNKKTEDIKEDRMSLVIWGFSCVVSTCLERAGFINSLVPYLQNVTHFLLQAILKV